MKTNRYSVKLMSGKCVTIKATSVSRARAKASQHGLVSHVEKAESRLWVFGFVMIVPFVYFCYMTISI